MTDESKRIPSQPETEHHILKIGANQPIRISAGHRLQHHSGKCSRPHGHNYEITAEIAGELTDNGWVVDKGKVTAIVNEWDHRFLLEEDDPLITAFEKSGDDDAVIVLEQPPTAEVIALTLKQRLLDALPDNVKEISVTVRETSELSAGIEC